MTDRDCLNLTKAGDCLTRNSRKLCDYCDSLLSSDERVAREILQYVADARSKAQRVYENRAPRKCVARQKWGNGASTCRDKKLTNLCAFCITSLNDRQLHAYAKKIVRAREESRQYWAEYNEAQEYAEELKAQGVRGIDWNIEQVGMVGGESELTERMYIIEGLFNHSKPCFVHGGEGLL
jgi:hypothetical protein